MKNKIYIGEKKPGYDWCLCPGKNLFTGASKFLEEFGDVNSLEEDMINFAAGVYAADLCVKRDDREHYIRTIEIDVEVVNVHLFERVKKQLEHALYVVSKDNWTIRFTPKKGGIPVSDLNWTNKEGATLLFSGGLDSMSAASEFLRSNKDLVLLSHNSQANHVVDNCQKNIHGALEKFYKKKIRHVNIKVFGRHNSQYPFPKDGNRENTQRTRSFLFLVLAALVARRSNFNKILYMAENGQFAIHLPLNAARIGPFSTHTADPEFVLLMQELLKVLLINPVFEIKNPFLYKTKAEVVSLLPDKLKKAASASSTCWMISRIPGNKHCGYCIPCISRRIALEYNDISFKEYHYDVFKKGIDGLESNDDKMRNLIDYLEFIQKFQGITQANKHGLKNDFPELYNPFFHFDSAVDLYVRVSEQSYQVLNRYPKIKKLI